MSTFYTYHLHELYSKSLRSLQLVTFHISYFYYEKHPLSPRDRLLGPINAINYYTVKRKTPNEGNEIKNLSSNRIPGTKNSCLLVSILSLTTSYESEPSSLLTRYSLLWNIPNSFSWATFMYHVLWSIAAVFLKGCGLPSPSLEAVRACNK